MFSDRKKSNPTESSSGINLHSRDLIKRIDNLILDCQNPDTFEHQRLIKELCNLKMFFEILFNNSEKAIKTEAL